MAYRKPILVIVLLIIVSAFAMQLHEEPATGITGNVVEERPIQDVVKDLEEAGWERVANDPVSYTK